MKPTRYLSAILCATALSGCSITDQSLAYFGPEAGSEITGEGFGLATANNVAVQNGDLSSMMANLTLKFAREVPAKINFEFNSSALDETAKSALRQQAAWIKSHGRIVFRVYGHTDKVGSNSYNQRLGLRRARTAVNYMVSLGVSRSKLKAVSSFGETRPLVLTESANRENRRTVTEVSGFARRGRGSDLDGKYAKTVYDKYISTTYVVESESDE
ncbi:MAG: OmpA family protein [Rhodobacteraceae bacterium]|nr:OmpA family protein [Paracoccaceae bacterium]